MAEGRSKALWSHTATVIAYLCEIHRDAKKRSRPFTPDDFNPYAGSAGPSSEKPRPVMVPFASMRQGLYAGLPEKVVRASDVRLAPAR